MVLLAASLVMLTLQNSTPSLSLIFLGSQTVLLPLGVWLSAAIAAGVLTALAISLLTSGQTGMKPPPDRRQWTVRPDVPPAYSPPAKQCRPSPSTEQSRAKAAPAEAFRDRSPTPAPTTAQASEDWQIWQQRTSPRQWNDWSEASGHNPMDATLNKRQRQDRQKAETTIQDLEKGWDDSAQDTVYVAPGGSQVQDALDEIEDGWEDWDTEENPLANTAYAQSYDPQERATRRDSIYAPPDASDRPDEEESVYDADYRVILPPYRPLAEDDQEPGRPT
jgi:hypothetical protein